jgi:hypothetical protein
VHVQFLEFEDIAADPEGSSVHGESSDEIIYHRSQAEAGILLVFLNFSSFLNPFLLQGMPIARRGWVLNFTGARWGWSAIKSKRSVLMPTFFDPFGSHLMFELQVRWLEAAAAQDHPDGLYNMAVMHAYGHGGAPQNNDLARQYFERAAALDFAPAKNGLAMLLSNTGSEKDLQEAFKLFNESSALGNSDGYYNKGILLRQGQGVAKDPVAARVALQAAADLGHPSACVMLAEMLVIGEGGPDDYIGALLLLKLISGVTRCVKRWRFMLPHGKCHPQFATKLCPLFITFSHRNGQNWSRSQRWHQVLCRQQRDRGHPLAHTFGFSGL